MVVPLRIAFSFVIPSEIVVSPVNEFQNESRAFKAGAPVITGIRSDDMDPQRTVVQNNRLRFPRREKREDAEHQKRERSGSRYREENDFSCARHRMALYVSYSTPVLRKEKTEPSARLRTSLRSCFSEP